MMLAEGLMKSLKGWLEPLPNGSLPNAAIRTQLLRVLQALHIDLGSESNRDSMKQSGLARVVMFLSKCPDESPDNRRAASVLCTRWLGQLGLGSGGGGGQQKAYVTADMLSEPERERRARLHAAKRAEQMAVATAPTGVKPGDAEWRDRSRPAQPTGNMDFKVLPASDLGQVDPRVSGQGKTKAQKEIKNALRHALGKGRGGPR